MEGEVAPALPDEVLHRPEVHVWIQNLSGKTTGHKKCQSLYCVIPKTFIVNSDSQQAIQLVPTCRPARADTAAVTRTQTGPRETRSLCGWDRNPNSSRSSEEMPRVHLYFKQLPRGAAHLRCTSPPSTAGAALRTEASGCLSPVGERNGHRHIHIYRLCVPLRRTSPG